MNAAEAFRSRWDHPSFVSKRASFGKKWSYHSYCHRLAATPQQRLHDAAKENDVDEVHKLLQAGAVIPAHTFALCCIEGHGSLVRVFLEELLAKFPESQHLFKCLNFLFALRARSWRKIMYRQYLILYIDQPGALEKLLDICLQWGTMLQVKHQLLQDVVAGNQTLFLEHANSRMYSWTFDEEEQLALAVQNVKGNDIALYLLHHLQAKESRLKFRKTSVYDAVRNGLNFEVIDRMLELMKARNVKINVYSSIRCSILNNEAITRTLLRYNKHTIRVRDYSTTCIITRMITCNVSTDIFALFIKATDLWSVPSQYQKAMLSLVSNQPDYFGLLLKQSWVTLSLIEDIIFSSSTYCATSEAWTALYNYPGLDIDAVREDIMGGRHSPISFQLFKRNYYAVMVLLDRPDLDLSEDTEALPQAALQFPENEEIFHRLMDKGAVVSEELEEFGNQLLNTIIRQRRKKSARAMP